MVELVKNIIDKNVPLISNLSNVCGILKDLEDINWCGFYLVQDDYLYLGPFQGDVACTIIKIGKGVCGKAFLEKKTIVVEDVTKFPGHIACSEKSRSEIVVPIIKNNKVVAEIDIDAPILNRFKNEEKEMLENIALILKNLF